MLEEGWWSQKPTHCCWSSCPRTKLCLGTSFCTFFLIDSITLFLNSHTVLKSHLSGCTNLVSSSGCLFLPEYFLHTFINSLMKTPFVIYLDLPESQRSHLCFSFFFFILSQILSHNRLKQECDSTCIAQKYRAIYNIMF